MRKSARALSSHCPKLQLESRRIAQTPCTSAKGSKRIRIPLGSLLQAARADRGSQIIVCSRLAFSDSVHAWQSKKAIRSGSTIVRQRAGLLDELPIEGVVGVHAIDPITARALHNVDS